MVFTGGIGFKLYIPFGSHEELPDIGEKVRLQAHVSVKEDDISIYGFMNPEQLAIFELIINVSGIGPKIALALVGRITPTNFYLSVLNEQVSQLTDVPGIGKKSAQRIILELKEKVNELTSKEMNGAYEQLDQKKKATKPELGGRNHAEELKAALSSLGYTNKEIDIATAAVKNAAHADMEMEELLRMALQKLNQR